MPKAYDARDVLAAIRTVLPHGEKIGHHEPRFGPKECLELANCARLGLTSYHHVDTFEDEIAKACTVKHAIAVCNGTAALHIALVVAGVKPGDAVIVPSLTFAGSANAICHAGASPVFVDCESLSFGIAPYKLDVFFEREVGPGNKLRRTGARIAAIMPVHILGRPCRMVELTGFGINRGIPIIEDAAEALGSSALGRPCGSFGSMAAISFNSNKIITTGGGGAVLTDSDEAARQVLRLCTTARVPHAYEVSHDAIAWNYRMPNVCAALGVAQIRQLAAFKAAKLALARAYEGALRAVPGVLCAPALPDGNNWLNAILIDPRWPEGRQAILSTLNRAGIGARAIFKPLHTLPMFKNCLRDDPRIAEDLYRRMVCLPSGVALGERLQ